MKEQPGRSERGDGDLGHRATAEQPRGENLILLSGFRCELFAEIVGDSCIIPMK